MRNLRPREGGRVFRAARQKHAELAGLLGAGQAERSTLFPLLGRKCILDLGEVSSQDPHPLQGEGSSLVGWGAV